MGTKHTPGPWVWTSNLSRMTGGDGTAVIDTESAVDDVIWASETLAQDFRNAQLIAAAPELLEALILAVEDEPNACFADTARAVIAKAKGETNA